MSKSQFPKKMRKDGTPNPKYVDVLSEETSIPGQEYFLMSFINPEDILKQKNIYMFEHFVRNWDINKKFEKFQQFMNFISAKYGLDIQKMNEDFKEFADVELPEIRSGSTIEDDYKLFMETNGKALQERFEKEHNFNTSVQAVKFRGAFATREEADERIKLLREIDPDFDIKLGVSDQWQVSNADAFSSEDVVYLEEELNQLVHEKKKNEAIAKAAFDKRRQEAKAKAIEENKAKAAKYGNPVTQDIDENGELYEVPVSKKTITSKNGFASGEQTSTVEEVIDTVFNSKEPI